MKESSSNPNLVPLTLNKRIESVRDDNYRRQGGTSFKEHIFKVERERHESILEAARSKSQLNLSSYEVAHAKIPDPELMDGFSAYGLLETDNRERYFRKRAFIIGMNKNNLSDTQRAEENS